MYFTAPVKDRSKALIAVLALLEVALGGLLLLCPGFWQELVHPDAIGTIFYPLQQTGVIWITRGLLAGIAWRRRGLYVVALSAAFLIEAPSELFAVWRVGDAGPWAGWVHAGRAVFCVGAGVWLWRLGARPRA